MVSDALGAGVSFNCPHCNTVLVIPSLPLVESQTATTFTGATAPAVPSSAIRAAAIAAATVTATHTTLGVADGNLWVAQEKQWQDHQQTSQQAIAGVERDQRTTALRAECDWLASQLDEERQRRQLLEPELDNARTQWTASETRAGDLEAGYHQASLLLQQTQITVEELSAQIELVKTERTQALATANQHHDSCEHMSRELDRARAERAEMEQILGRARLDLEQATTRLSAAESLAENSTKEAAQAKATLTQMSADLDTAVAARAKLDALVHEDHTLEDFIQVRTERDSMDLELQEIHARLDDFRTKAEELAAEREVLRRERTDLQLTVAALRDAHDDTQLQQDNEVLRRMVERLNEELKAVLPESGRRKKKRTDTGSMVSGLARAVAARMFIPDADAVEGQ